MKPKVQASIIIPTLNEQGNISELCRRLASSLEPVTEQYELIFIDDHSTDKTLARIKKAAKLYPVRWRLKKAKPGKSFSILEGSAIAKYELIGMIDADLQYPPEALPAMIEAAATSELVVAQRQENNSALPRKIGTSLQHWFFLALFGLGSDVQAGLKVFRKSLISSINPADVGPWTLDLQLLQKAKERGGLIQSVPISFGKRGHGSSKFNLLRDGSAIVLNGLGVKFKDQRSALTGLTSRTWSGQLLRFGLVGIVNTAVDIGLFYALSRRVPFFTSHIILAKALSYSIAAFNSFLLNSRYTFRAKRTYWSLLLPFGAVSTVGVAINSSVLFLAINYLGLAQPLALALATAAAFVWNFTLSKLYIFKERPADIYSAEIKTPTAAEI